MRPASTPWFGAALRTTEDARQACDLAARLSTPQPARCCCTAAAAPRGDRAAAAAPATADAAARMRLYAAVAQTLRTLGAGVYAGRPGAARGGRAGTAPG